MMRIDPQVGHKNDAKDAEAICEAVGRPSMRFVAIKSQSQPLANKNARVLWALLTRGEEYRIPVAA